MNRSIWASRTARDSARLSLAPTPQSGSNQGGARGRSKSSGDKSRKGQETPLTSGHMEDWPDGVQRKKLSGSHPKMDNELRAAARHRYLEIVRQ